MLLESSLGTDDNWSPVVKVGLEDDPPDFPLRSIKLGVLFLVTLWLMLEALLITLDLATRSAPPLKTF